MFKGKSSSSHVGIRNASLVFCYDGTKHYQVSFKKQGRRKVFKKLPASLRVFVELFWSSFSSFFVVLIDLHLEVNSEPYSEPC